MDVKYRFAFGVVLLFILLLASCKDNGGPVGQDSGTTVDQTQPARLGNNGYRGYIGYISGINSSFGMGVSFYTAAWKLIDKPLSGFQVGLPGTWIIPDNLDNTSIPLCPEGTVARNWLERGPTWVDVFQTLEGGLGYWRGNKYRYDPPKFSMNATPQCYDYEVASPGWSFFKDEQALKDDLLGIAQLSNRLLIPPDALPFEGNPDGKFMGYAYMALPLTDAYDNSIVSIGNNSWTCFINTENFKGPIAYYLPETWAKLSESYKAIEGRGLDNRPGIINGGAMEINSVPNFNAFDQDGEFYIKVPKLNFPVNETGKSPLVQDLRYYNENALYNEILDWRKNDIPSDGSFKTSGMYEPKISVFSPILSLMDIKISGMHNVFRPYTKNGTFGFTWEDSAPEPGSFPEYFKKSGNYMVPISKSEVPDETKLVEATFPLQANEGMYSSPNEGNWKSPGPADGPYNVTLNDGSTITYYWYRFIDQPVFGQFNWTEEKKASLQSLIEDIHMQWGIHQDYIPAPTSGSLISIDDNLIVTPPEGLEVGYVPIVTSQRL